MKKCAIFDLDGTLTNTLESLWMSGNSALTDAGLVAQPLESYKYFAGDGADELVRRILVAAGDKELTNYELVRKQYAEHFKEYVNYNVVPYDGIIEALHVLKANGIFLAVNTNKPENRAVQVINHFFGEQLFDMVVGECSERPRKPAPDGINHIIRQLNISSDEVIYFGDTSVDMKTGKSAGVYTVGVLWGFREKQELRDNNADCLIERANEIPGLFDISVN